MLWISLKDDRAYLPHMGDFVEPPPKHRTQWKPRKTTTQRPSPFVLFLVLFGSSPMNWDHAASWGRGVWLSVSDIGRVGQPELVISQPELKKKQKNQVSCCLAWVGVRQNHPYVVNRRAPAPGRKRGEFIVFQGACWFFNCIKTSCGGIIATHL